MNVIAWTIWHEFYLSLLWLKSSSLKTKS